MASADEIQSYIESILDPKPIDSLDPVRDLHIFIYESPTEEPHELHLTSIYPFMTILDVKLAIYDKLKMDDRALPEFVFLGKRILPGKKLTPVEFNWSLSTQPTDAVSLYPPFSLTAPDPRFVDSNGTKIQNGRTQTDRVTLEDKYSDGIPILYAYLYSAVEASIQGVRPLSERDWNGRIYPYFPSIPMTNDRPTDIQRDTAKKLTKAFIRKRQFFMKLNSILNGGDPIYYLSLKAVGSILLTFKNPEKISGIEHIFYTVPVTDLVPYMRLLPVEGEPISKVHMIGDIPDVENPDYLRQWSQERNPTPERDFVLVKVMIKKGTSPLYSTIRLYDDGTADITLEPRRGISYLDTEIELEGFSPAIVSAIAGFSYLTRPPQITNGTFLFDINLRDVFKTKLDARIIRGRLPIFSAIFQEIRAPPGDTAEIVLRYKLVSNFLREDTIESYITMIRSRKLLKGDSYIADLPDLISNEFQISKERAREYLEKKLQSASDIIMANPETKEYTLNNNTGIDIAIYTNEHPTYKIKVFNVNSYINMQRLITFVSLLMSRPEQEFAVPEEHVAEYELAEVEEEEEAEAEAEGVAEAEAVGVAEAVPEAEAEGVAEAEDVFENDDKGSVPDELPDYLLDFAGDNMTLEQEHAEEEAAAAEKIEGTVMPEPPLQSKFAMKKRANVAAAATFAEPEVTSKFALKKRENVAAAATFAEPEVTGRRSGGLETYFSDKLKEADRRLFEFKQTDGSAKTKYVVQCASNLMRQPAVLNEVQYQRMKDEYKDLLDSGEITFFQFPLERDKKAFPYNPDPKKEYYTIMKYGSSPRVQNYYICCKYFCIRDVIMIREKELEGTVLRRAVRQADGSERKTKEPGTCPFCEGTVVKNKRFPGVNEVVIERKRNIGNGRDLYIRFLKKTNHPEGLFLPCCFLEDQPIRIGQHPAFQEADQVIQGAIASPEAAAEEVAQDEGLIITDETTLLETITVSYETTLLTARTASIVGAEKLPLDPALKKIRKVLRFDKTKGRRVDLEEEAGKRLPPEITQPQIGILPTQINEYFSQNPTDIVSRTFNPQKLTPGSRGFLRIGVQNSSRHRNDSFLAAVAIYFYKMDTVDEIKEMLTDVIQPRVFLSMNYGNFALEMYDPMWVPRTIVENPKGLPPTREQIKNWAYNYLRIRKLTARNEDLVKRAYLSYDKFRWWLASTTTRKEYRHFAHFFSLPGLMNIGRRSYALDSSKISEYRRPGVIFIVLDILESGELKIRCTPYAMQNEVLATSDIGFLFHHYSGIWEPIFYYDNKALLNGELNQSYLTFSGLREGDLLDGKFPPIIRKRLEEFRTQCSSRTGGLGIYTSSAGIKSTKVVALSIVKKMLSAQQLYGFIRDAYNHIVALVYRIEPTGLIAVPVIDDGLSFIDLEYKLIMDWDDFEPATIGQVVSFYRKFVEPVFPTLYKIQHAVKTASTQRIESVQLSNGLYIPVGVVSNLPEGLILPEPIQTIEEMEWSINKKIVVESTVIPEQFDDKDLLKTEEFNESFEYLRITFSNWLNSNEDGGNFRRELEDVIFSKEFPIYEKRRRLQIKIAPIVEKWIAEKNEDKPRQISILRKDCTLLAEKDCKGLCSWKTDSGKCLIHVSKPSTTTIDGRVQASGGSILLLRLIEELIRFGGRRKQIFEGRVSEITVLTGPIRENDQYIIPERSYTWTEMLRNDWTKVATDEPVFIEEMVSDTNEIVAPVAVTELTKLPDAVSKILNPSGTDPLADRLRLYPSPSGIIPLLALLQVTGADIGLVDQKKLDDKTMTALVKKSLIPVIQIDLQERDASKQIMARRAPRDRFYKYAIFVIKEDGSPNIIVTDPEAPALLQSGDITAETRAIFENKAITKTVFVLAKG